MGNRGGGGWLAGVGEWKLFLSIDVCVDHDCLYPDRARLETEPLLSLAAACPEARPVVEFSFMRVRYGAWARLCLQVSGGLSPARMRLYRFCNKMAIASGMAWPT